MGTPLAAVFSAIDSAKRKGSDLVAGLLSDPREQLRQWVVNNNNEAGANLDKLGALYKDSAGRPTFDPAQWNPYAKAAEADLRNQALGAVMGATVWHGSPHVFDKFDASKIGTGEGAQVYGHGIYLAENPQVARSYAETLSGVNNQTPAGRASRTLTEAGGDLLKARKILQSEFESASSPTMQNAAQQAIDALNRGEARTASNYKVDLPDEHIARMLDWDKPLSQQPANVRQAWADTMRAWGMPEDFTAGRGTIGDTMRNSMMEPELQKRGVPGVRYLDQFSRGSGGTSNFVLFPGSESLATIQERNGMPIGLLDSLGN